MRVSLRAAQVLREPSGPAQSAPRAPEYDAQLRVRAAAAAVRAFAIVTLHFTWMLLLGVGLLLVARWRKELQDTAELQGRVAAAEQQAGAAAGCGV